MNASALLDGAPFTSGSVVGAEGGHTLTATATDAAGNTASLTRHFTIDKTPPQFVSVQPTDGSLLGTGGVVISGQVRDAARITVDGASPTPTVPFRDNRRNRNRAHV